MRKERATTTGVMTAGQDDPRLKNVLNRLTVDGPERQAIDRGEIDALIDYQDTSIILFFISESGLHVVSRSPALPDPLKNAILAALPRSEYLRLRHALEPVLLTSHELLQESGTPIRYAYFPIDSVISLLATVENRQMLEVALVGSEGMVGISLSLGVNVSSVRALVAIAGNAVRLSEEHFLEVFRQNPLLRKELSRFTYTNLVMARQTAACRAFHKVEQRFARRLLMIADRLHSTRYFCTHESAAGALGVRRESITQVASALQKRGLITYSRGNIRILNRKRLESVACGCYARIESRIDWS